MHLHESANCSLKGGILDLIKAISREDGLCVLTIIAMYRATGLRNHSICLLLLLVLYIEVGSFDRLSSTCKS